MMSDFKQRLTSRKFLLTLAGSVAILLKIVGVLPADNTELWQLIAALMGYIGIEGAKDLVSAWRQGNLTPEDNEAS